jgi:hypothetical protein
MKTTTRLCAFAAAATFLCGGAFAQTPTEPPAQSGPPNTPAASPEATVKSDQMGKPDASAPTDAGPLAALSWLAGCWQGTVNQREFREHWLPLRGGVLIGAGQSVLRGSMLDYQFLRLEPRPDGIYFSQFSGDRKETSFKLSNTATDDRDTIYTFTNTVDAFPTRLIYRRGTEGWLYETIEGTLNAVERKVVYPLRRVDCEGGEFIRQ